MHGRTIRGVLHWFAVKHDPGRGDYWYAVDELTGLIWAYTLMRLEKSAKEMEIKSLKKKFKDKRFATGCSREAIRAGAERLGWDWSSFFLKRFWQCKVWRVEAAKKCLGPLSVDETE